MSQESLSNIGVNKKIFFLTGLPRAGNTLFSCLMNQNPRISVTANSNTSEILWQISNLKNGETFKNFPDHESLDNILSNILPNYYSKWKADYIIDRSTWGIKANIDLLKKYLKNEIKIIVLERSLIEVLSSFIRFSKNNTNFLSGFDSVEKQCDHLMGYNSQINRSMLSVNELKKPEYKNHTHFIQYDDLVNNTKHEMDKVYEFLGIGHFEHSYTNLSQLENNDVKYNDKILGGDLHKIKTDKIQKSDYKVKDVLTDELIEKYTVIEKSMNGSKEEYLSNMGVNI